MTLKGAQQNTLSAREEKSTAPDAQFEQRLGRNPNQGVRARHPELGQRGLRIVAKKADALLEGGRSREQSIFVFAGPGPCEPVFGAATLRDCSGRDSSHPNITYCRTYLSNSPILHRCLHQSSVK